MRRSHLLGIGLGAIIVGTSAFWLLGGSAATSGPDQWRHYRQKSGDNRPWPEASVDEVGGPGRLVLHCSGAFGAFFLSERTPARPDVTRAAIRYRLDDGPPIARIASYSGDSLWFDEVTRGEDDPLVGQLERAHRLIVEATPEGEPRFVMRFDLSQAGPAVRRLRDECSRRG